jgi:alpha-D-ribose 1-methylphosphonate 5-triphosphate diphosphatase
MSLWQPKGAAAETIFANARLVLRDEVVAGGLHVVDGSIRAIDQGETIPGGSLDLDGDFLIAGLIDLHTDNLEKHYQPRKDVFWDAVNAAMSHDGQVISAGITTVFDSLTVGAARGWDIRAEMVQPMINGLTEAHEQRLLRADHFLHLRCEVTHPEIKAIVEQHIEHPLSRFLSLMDHAPGDRQSPDVDRYRKNNLAAFGHDEAELDAHIKDLMTKSKTIAPGNRRTVASLSQRHGVPLASHDDASAQHMEEASELGCVIAEFPTTLEAAAAGRALGLKVLMGAPNLIRGGSHSGNVAAGDLAKFGHLDLFASDYIPSSMLAAAFKLTDEPLSWSLPRALWTVTGAPAEASGLGADRGEIAEGKRADLVWVRRIQNRPIIRGVWRNGVRVL